MTNHTTQTKDSWFRVFLADIQVPLMEDFSLLGPLAVL